MSTQISIKKGETYLITGGSGFLGKVLTKRLLEAGAKVRCLARNEGNIIGLQQEYPIEVFPGDVSDPVDVRQAMRGVRGVFHLAAFKHVGLAEKFSRECTKSNTVGSLIVLEASLDYSLDFVIGISTDKAAQISGVYGASKFLMEKLFQQFEVINPDVKYRLVRYGNVMYSTGSVMCKWKKLMQDGEQCIITDPEATRFYWTVDDAIELIFDCLAKAHDSTPYCPEMKSMRLGDLFQAMSEVYYKTPINPQVIGLQTGENFHEVILEDSPHSGEAEKFTIDEIKEMV
jgi:FlaA1/EpsC-like NDP-sugar epimerase